MFTKVWFLESLRRAFGPSTVHASHRWQWGVVTPSLVKGVSSLIMPSGEVTSQSICLKGRENVTFLGLIIAFKSVIGGGGIKGNFGFHQF